MSTNPQDERKLPWPEHSEFGGEKLLPASTGGPDGPKSHRTLWLFLLAFAIVFGCVILVGWFFHHRDKEATEKLARQQRDAKPIVETAKVQPGKEAQGVVVPGTTIPLTEAFVYARANGYLKKRLVDIGDKVHEGQLLAVIDAPDLDAQVSQARQQLAQAEQQLEQQKSQLALATVTVQRYRVLVVKGVLSRQDGDQQETNYSSQVANVAAAQRNVEAFKANLQRQVALQSYEYVRAPFSGVITQRNADIGALVSAGGGTSGGTSPAPQGQNSSSGGSNQAGSTNNGGTGGSPSTVATSAQTPGQGGPLFAIAQNNRLRILISVPEGYATAIHTGSAASVAFQEYAGATFPGTITRSANSIDANTRTLLTEVQVDNSQGKLVPGMYTVVTFAPPPGTQAPLLIVGEAVVIRRDQSMVATIVNDKVKLVPVVIGRDFGSAVEILAGLKAGDIIVTDVTDDVTEGREVQTHMAAGPEQQPQAPSQTNPPGGSSQYSNQGITDQNLQGQQAQQNGKGQGKGESKGQNKSSSESKP
jgi:multidrug efflux pump subunit AcrA (membrane-fusion protein)